MGQNAAPLDYIALRFLVMMKKPLDSLGLADNTYYRLNSIIFSFSSGIGSALFLFFLIKKKVRNILIFLVQAIFIILAFTVYLFWWFNIKFAIEARPYALWNSLWYLSLVLIIGQGRISFLTAIFFSLLAMAATASIFQLGCLAVCFVTFNLLDARSPREIVRVVLKYFILLLAVCGYYILINKQSLSYFRPEYFNHFFKFWLEKEMVPILSVSGILMTVFLKECRIYTIVFSAMLLLYLASPVLNYITLSKGFLFSSRQYIFYDLIYPVFIINAALILPVYLEKIRRLKKEI